VRKIYALIIALTFCLPFISVAQNAKEPRPIWCTPAIELGESKESVQERWGEPDIKRKLEPDETGLRREEWIYRSTPFTFMSEHSYVCATQRLVFTGGYLTSMESGEEAIENIKTDDEEKR